VAFSTLKLHHAFKVINYCDSGQTNVLINMLTCWLGGRNGIWPVKNIAGWWRWALVSPDGLAPSRMVGVSASVNLQLHHKAQKFSSATGSPGWSWKKGCKTIVAC